MNTERGFVRCPQCSQSLTLVEPKGHPRTGLCSKCFRHFKICNAVHVVKTQESHFFTQDCFDSCQYLMGHDGQHIDRSGVTW